MCLSSELWRGRNSIFSCKKLDGYFRVVTAASCRPDCYNYMASESILGTRIADNSLYVMVARYLSRPVPDERCSGTAIFPLLVSTLHDDCSQRFRKHVRHRPLRVASACPGRSIGRIEKKETWGSIVKLGFNRNEFLLFSVISCPAFSYNYRYESVLLGLWQAFVYVKTYNDNEWNVKNSKRILLT